MPVFISYSHADRDFVDRLAAHLVKAKAHVWVDRWELRVGDSLIAKIQEAIQTASALVVILSQASLKSEWCKKELNAGLVRELEEKRVIVLPLLLEHCEMPLFLREKMYADFRTNFGEGLKQVLEAIAKVTSDTLGRVDGPEWHIDWAVDWLEIEDHFCLRLTLVEQAQEKPYTVLSQINMIANDIATSRYRQYDKAGLGHLGRQVLFEMLRGCQEFGRLQVLIEDSFPRHWVVEAHDPKTGAGLNVKITCRRLGEDTGRDIVLNLGDQVSHAIGQMFRTLRPLTPQEKAKVKQIISTPI
jgi:hypothetical protein